MALPRGLAPRTSAFAGRHAEFCYTSGAWKWCAMPVLPRRLRFGMRGAEAPILKGRGALTAWRPEPQHRRACCYTNDAKNGGCCRYRAGLSSSSGRR